MQKISPHKIIIFIVVAITIAMGVMIFIYPPAIFPDPSHGFEVMRSMQMGGKFNCLVTPNQDNIAENTSQFLTWWSPGQYLVPYFFNEVFGVNMGQASALTISLFELSGLLGFYCFFKKIGFTSTIAAYSLLFIACQVSFIIPYVFYNGGEILLFGFLGWFLYGCVVLKKPGWQLVLFVLFTGWTGFFCKSSFMWMYGAGLIFLWIRLSGKWDFGTYFKNGFWVFLPAVVSIAAIYIFFLSKGPNPAAASNGLKLSWESFSFPLASPMLAGFSVDDMFQGLVNHPAFTPYITIAILLSLAIVSVIIIACIVNYVPNNNYQLLVTVFYLVSVLFFASVYLRQLNISYEGRHFRLIGLLVVPGVIYLINKLKLPYKTLFALVCAVTAVISYSFLIKGFVFNANTSAHGNSGIAHYGISQTALNYIDSLDRRNNNAVFVFTNQELGLEIAHNRTIPIDMPVPGATIDPYDYIYDGHAGPLILVIPSKYSGAQITMLQKFFPGYNNFSVKNVGDYLVYSAK